MSITAAKCYRVDAPMEGKWKMWIEIYDQGWEDFCKHMRDWQETLLNGIERNNVYYMMIVVG